MEELDESIALVELMRDRLLDASDHASEMKACDDKLPIEVWLNVERFKRRQEMVKELYSYEIATFSKLADMADRILESLQAISREAEEATEDEEGEEWKL